MTSSECSCATCVAARDALQQLERFAEEIDEGRLDATPSFRASLTSGAVLVRGLLAAGER